MNRVDSAEAGFTGFVRREYRRMVDFVRRRLVEAEGLEAEDIVQEVLTGVFDRADISVPVHNLAAYIYRSLRNRVVDAWRMRRGTLSIDGSSAAGGSLAEVLADGRRDAAAAVELEELEERFRREMARLGPREQAILRATEWEGRTFRELAAEWGVPVGTLLARKSRALQKLRNRLDDSRSDSGGGRNG